MGQNDDLFGEEEMSQTESNKEAEENDDWGEDPEESKEPEEERLDSSEVLRNEKIAYSKKIEDGMNKFFRNDDNKILKWTITRRNPFYFKILRMSAVLGFVRATSGSTTLFNFYDKKLMNRVKKSKDLKGFFDFA